MILKYYKTNNQELIKMIKDYLESKIKFSQDAIEWANKFNAVPLVSSDWKLSENVKLLDWKYPRYNDDGSRNTYRTDLNLWKKPTKEGHSRPKLLRGADKNNPDLIKLRQEFFDTCPNNPISDAEIKKAWGVTREMECGINAFFYENDHLYMGSRLSYFIHDGFAYAQCRFELPHEEITGSEYLTAFEGVESK